MDLLDDKIEGLVKTIYESEEYRSFLEAKQMVYKVPRLAENIRSYCWQNYELQNSGTEDLYEKMEEFEAKYREFRKDPIVTVYLERELRMCRMLQEINARITDSVDIML